MLINLLPDFFAVLNSTDRVAAYHQYFEAHRHRLAAYWHNYVIEPAGPHFEEVVRETVRADRSDLRAMLERTDILALARDTSSACPAPAIHVRCPRFPRVVERPGRAGSASNGFGSSHASSSRTMVPGRAW